MYVIKNIRSEFSLGYRNVSDSRGKNYFLAEMDELQVKFEVEGRFDYMEVQGIINDITKMLKERAEVVYESPG